MASSDDQLRELVRGMEEDYLLVSVDEVVRHLDEVVDELRKEPSSCNAIHNFRIAYVFWMDKGSPKLGRSLQSAMKEALKLEKAYRLVEEERASAVHQARAAEGEMDEAVEGTMVWDAAGEMEGVTEGVNGRGAESAADYAAEETEVEQLAQEDHELDPAVANPLQHPEGYEGEEFDLKSDYQEKIKASAVHILAVHLSEMVQLFEDGLNIAPGHSGTQHIIVPPCVSCVDADTLCTALLGQPCCERCRGQQKVCDRGVYRSAELLAHPKLGIALRASDLNPIVTGLRGLLGSTRGTLSSTERQVISEAVDALNSAEGMHELISLSGRSADDMVLS